MASDLAFVEYVCDQIGAAGAVSYRKMFGDYAIYCDGKVIALVCDNQFFLKPTAGARKALGTVTEAPPYPGAKLYFLIDEALEDRELMAALVRGVWQETPAPKPKKAKSPAKKPAKKLVKDRA